jgi:hypothetical protein
MYARVATFEGAEPGQVQAAIDAISSAGAPPEGVDATGLTVYADSGTGRVIIAGRFATREAMDRAHEVLSAMSPPSGSFGRQVSVDLMEVRMDVGARALGAPSA